VTEGYFLVTAPVKKAFKSYFSALVFDEDPLRLKTSAKPYLSPPF
jgi:hypothetical protein